MADLDAREMRRLADAIAKAFAAATTIRERRAADTCLTEARGRFYGYFIDRQDAILASLERGERLESARQQWHRPTAPAAGPASVRAVRTSLA